MTFEQDPVLRGTHGEHGREAAAVLCGIFCTGIVTVISAVFPDDGLI